MPGGGPPWIQAPESRRFRLRAVVGAGVGGVVLGLGLGVVAIVLLAAFAGDSFFAPGAIAGSHGPVTDDAPQTGDCLRPGPARSDVTGRADVVDCDVDHGSEVIGIATLPDLGRLPDTSDLDYFVDEACRLSFSDYVGGSYDESDLWFGAVVPNDAAWAAGDRTVYCLLESVDFREGRGSARGSA